jgi:hypothetical protein
MKTEYKKGWRTRWARYGSDGKLTDRKETLTVLKHLKELKRERDALKKGNMRITKSVLDKVRARYRPNKAGYYMGDQIKKISSDSQWRFAQMLDSPRDGSGYEKWETHRVKTGKSSSRDKYNEEWKVLNKPAKLKSKKRLKKVI